jgi:radical SAM superfamily enzyme YgiQ (UPF0313 family)
MRNERRGTKVVLTADRTLMSEYQGGIFLGFSACIPRGLIPDTLFFSLICPSVPVDGRGAVRYAPCGLRKIEAKLVEEFGREGVVVAHPDHLGRAVGPDTHVLGVAETDPLGQGPATTTFGQILGGTGYMASKFRDILAHPAVKKFKPSIVVGGPGAWQLDDPGTLANLGLDSVVVGEGETVVSRLFRQAASRSDPPGIVHGPAAEESEIPTLRGGTIDGIVEIARGCGRGCAFCVPTIQKHRSLSIGHILADVGVNLRAGRRPLLHAEDVFRYGAGGQAPDPSAVEELFAAVRGCPGVEALGFSHFALSSVASSPGLIEDVSRLIRSSPDDPWISGQTGLETGSPRLMRKFMAGKAKPFEPEEWPQVVKEAFRILSANSWVPLATLILGLPEETDDDIQATIDLIVGLRRHKSLFIPLLMVGGGGRLGGAPSFRARQISRKQCELLILCWEHNLAWAPVLMEEYFALNRGVNGRIIKRVISYALKEARKLLAAGREKYRFDFQAMIRDAEAGRLPLPRMLRLGSAIAPSRRAKREWI